MEQNRCVFCEDKVKEIDQLRERIRELKAAEEQRKAEDAKLFQAARIKIQILQDRLRTIEEAAELAIKEIDGYIDASHVRDILADALGEEKSQPKPDDSENGWPFNDPYFCP